MAIADIDAFWIVNNKAISYNINVKLAKKSYLKKGLQWRSSKHKFHLSWLPNKLLQS